MKQCLALLLGLLLITVTLDAQDNSIKVGVDFGLANLDSDVESASKSGMTTAINLSKSLNQKWSIVTTYNYSMTRGLDFIPTYQYAGYEGQYFPSYQNHSHSLDVSANRNLKIDKSRLYFDLRLGVGITASKTMMDVLNSEGITYAQQANGLPYRLEGCPEIICGVESPDTEYLTYDGTYETQAELQSGTSLLGNHQLFITVPMQVSMMLKISKRLDLGLAFHARITSNDYIDGIGEYTLYNGETRASNNSDLYKSYRLLAYYRLQKRQTKLSY